MADKDIPGVVAPPPLIFLGFLGIGWALGRLIGEASLGLPTVARSGVALAAVLIGLAIEAWAAGLFRRAGTAVQPWKPSTALVRTGIYALSRNPIYVGFAIIYLGLALAVDSPLALILLVPCLLVIDRFVIQREERYLLARFGPAYADYRRTVRRWL